MRDYPYIVATANIMPELISLRGLLKRKFPDPRAGTLGLDIAELVRKHMTGVLYRAIRDEYQENYGSIKTTIGTVIEELWNQNSTSNWNVWNLIFVFFFSWICQPNIWCRISIQCC